MTWGNSSLEVVLVVSEPGVFTEVAEERRETAPPLSGCFQARDKSSSDISNLAKNPKLYKGIKMVGGARTVERDVVCCHMKSKRMCMCCSYVCIHYP